MPSAQVSVWVPLVVALVGLLGVVATQVLTTRREDRRWRQEQERVEARWRREKTQEIAERQLERKIETYAAFLTAVEAWGWKLHPIARRVLDGGALSLDDSETLATLREIPQDALGAVNLYAPDEVRDLIWRAVNSRGDFMRSLARGDESVVELDVRWKESWDRYRTMRLAIRDDLADSVKQSRPG